jgi:hypothetical protein
MKTQFTEDKLRSFILRGTRPKPLEQLDENAWSVGLGTLSISRHRPSYSDGFGHSLRPESRFYKMWFDLGEDGIRGWAIIFRIFDPPDEQTKHFESFPGWVPPEREAEADAWIERLNAEIRDRFAQSSASPP